MTFPLTAALRHLVVPKFIQSRAGLSPLPNGERKIDFISYAKGALIIPSRTTRGGSTVKSITVDPIPGTLPPSMIKST